MSMMLDRRQLLTALSLAGAAGFVGVPRARAVEGPAETTAIRLAKSPTICVAPQYVAEEMLRAEGFTDIRYVDTLAPDVPEAVARGQVDFSLAYASQFVMTIGAGEPVTLLAGVMVGCFELFAKEGIRNISDLKGRTVGVQAIGSTPHVLLTVLAAHVGLDPLTDIHWVTDPAIKPIELFVQGKIDAFLGFPPEPQDLRARHIGHVIVNTAVDRPVVAVFLLHVGRQPGVRGETSDRDKARRARHFESRRFLRQRSGRRRTTARRRAFHPALRLCCADAERAALRQMAGIRS